jgi:hypothetical protein
MDTAWGRRVYDQYEIEFESDRPRNKYMTSEPEDNREPREEDSLAKPLDFAAQLFLSALGWLCKQHKQPKCRRRSW